MNPTLNIVIRTIIFGLVMTCIDIPWIKFVMSKPYSKWYIIILDGKKIGSVYLTHQNEIGIQVVEEVRGKNIAKQALELIMEKNPKSRYLANINPKNKRSIKFFTKNGFKLIQYTYELIPEDTKNWKI